MPGTIEPIENNAYRIRHLKVDAEIGDKEVAGFKPKLKLNRWDGECSLTVGFQECDEEEFELETDGLENITKIKWKVKSDDFELELEYEALDPREETLIVNSTEHKFLQCDEGGLELRIILGNKPLVNVIEFTFQTEGLVFHYQPPLHPNHPTWADRSGNGEPDCFRPENVVGSYAVYHATRTNMHRNSADAEKYKACKAFQIYYPYLIDADGWKVRAEDFVIANGVMRITLPQAFLDSAVYPVVVDPDWGNTGTGDSGLGPLPASMLHGTAFTSPAVAGMTGVSMSLYCHDVGDNIKMGIWVNANGGALIANGLTNPVAVPALLNWATANFIAAPNIAASTIYLLSFIGQTGSVRWRFDTGAGASHTDWTNSYAAPGNFDWDNTETELICIYVTYAAAPAGWTGTISGVIDPAAIMGVDVEDISHVKGVASS